MVGSVGGWDSGLTCWGATWAEMEDGIIKLVKNRNEYKGAGYGA